MRFQCVQGPSLGFLRDCPFRSILHFHLSFLVDCSKKCLARSRWLEICVAQALFGKYFSQMVAAIKQSRFRS